MLVSYVEVANAGTKTELFSWLEQQLGPENVRWWHQKVPTVWYHEDPKPADRIKITMDVTDEEEPIVSAFILRWV